MTLVRNLLLLSSGNKIFIYVLLSLVILQSCRTPRAPRTPAPDSPREEEDARQKPDIPDVMDMLYPIEIKEEYHVAFLLPFFFDVNERTKPRNAAISNVAMEYYMGALIALDTMKNCGARFNIYTYDTRNDSNEVNRILGKIANLDIDLIIGPLLRKNMSSIYRFSAKNRISYLSPFYAPTDTMHNPYFMLSLPREEAFGMQAARYVNTQHQGERVLIVRQPTDNEIRMANGFKNKIKPDIGENIIERVFTQRSLANGFPEGVLDERNIMFVPSDEEIFVNAVITALRQTDKQVTLIGLSRWSDYSSLESRTAWSDYNIHLLSSYHVNTEEHRVQWFKHQYDNRFKEMPSEFAFRGFGDMLLMLSRLHNNGKYLQRHLFHQNFDLLHSNYFFEPDVTTSGFSNTYLHFIKLEENKLKKVNY